MKKYTIIGRKAVNQDSGNHCIGVDQLEHPERDFLFKFEDNTNIVISYSEISSYIKNHPEVWRTGVHVKDEDGNVKWIPIPFILIPDEFILSYNIAA